MWIANGPREASDRLWLRLFVCMLVYPVGVCVNVRMCECVDVGCGAVRFHCQKRAPRIECRRRRPPRERLGVSSVQSNRASILFYFCHCLIRRALLMCFGMCMWMWQLKSKSKGLPKRLFGRWSKHVNTVQVCARLRGASAQKRGGGPPCRVRQSLARAKRAWVSRDCGCM